jgi:hypothetical protein
LEAKQSPCSFQNTTERHDRTGTSPASYAEAHSDLGTGNGYIDTLCGIPQSFLTSFLDIISVQATQVFLNILSDSLFTK